jgi:L-idonate 5-dehydrogenase
MATSVQAVVAHAAHDLRVEPVAAQALGARDVEVRVAVGGICGSDLHYFHRGGVGDFTIREPLVLGHELAGIVARVGDAVDGLAVGDAVVVDPSAPCGVCRQCRRGRRNLCLDVRFLGSAARFPHAQGGFRERLVVDGAQCVPVPPGLTLERAVFAEPLSVAVHAVGRAGAILGRDVLITGAGPIGMLILLVALHAGAGSVTITDISEAPLRVARRLGAQAAINVSEPAALPPVEIAFEASGSEAALEACGEAVGPGGRIVLVGLLAPGLVPIAGNRMVTGEREVVGSFRFTGEEFRAAVAMLGAGLDVGPLLSGRFPLASSLDAFAAAGDRDRSLKVQLQFSDVDPAAAR